MSQSNPTGATHAAPEAPVSAQPDVVVVPDLTTFGWDGTEEGLDGLVGDAQKLTDAMEHVFSTDAMFQPLAVPGEPTWPRLNKPGAAVLAAEGLEPLLTWAVLDLDTPEHAAWPDQATADMALHGTAARLAARTGAAPYGYTTNNGLRLLWPLATPMGVTVAGSYLQQLHQYLLPALPTDLVFDRSCAQWWRVYRLPRVTRAGVVTKPTMLRGQPLAWTPPTLQAEVVQGLRVRGEVNPDLPEPRKLSAAEWNHIPEKWRAQLKSGKAMYEAHGNPGRDSGITCHLLPRLSAAMAHVEVVDPELVYQAVREVVEAQDEVPSLDRTWSRIQELVASDREAFAGQRAVHSAVVKLAYEAGKVEVVDAIRESVYPTNAHDETRKQADEARKSRKPYMVYAGDARHAFLREEDGCYRPKSLSVIGPLLEKHYQLDVRTKGGKFLAFPELFAMLGEDAREVRLRYWAPGEFEYFDEYSRVLYRTTPPPDREPRPVYNAEVAAWLDMLCEDPAMTPRLLDWVQSAPNTDHPIAALVLVGPRGVGKSLMGAGIGSGWGHTGDYNIMMRSTFNDDIGKSPVFLADEGLRVDNANAVEGFKSLITTRRHTLQMKWVNNATVEGCVRVLIAANKVEDVQVTADLNSESLAALEERILFIPCAPAAKAYLDRTDTRYWVTAEDGGPGAIFEHAMWLAQNRALSKPPGRLLVYGEPDGRWRTRRLASAGGLDGSALVALAHWAGRGQTTTGIGGHPDEPGRVLVNASCLHKAWVELTGDQRPPRLQTLSQALSTVSAWPDTRQLTVGTKRSWYYAIPVELVMQAAENCGIGDSAAMEVFLARQWTPANAETNRESV